MGKLMPEVEKAAEERGLIVLETNFVKEAGKWTIKIFIYNTEGPVTHEDCEKITKEIDKYAEEIIPTAYRLEVSSPGTERKLKSEKEYKIFRGERVKIKLKKFAEKEVKTFYAKIGDYTEDGGLKVETEDGEALKIKKEEISYIKLEPEYKY